MVLSTSGTLAAEYTTANTASSTQLNNLSDIKITNPFFLELLFGLGFVPTLQLSVFY
jgi:hypothetical protein